ncbi:MAG TPA: response regulator transcription factor [Planctomycetota bacterium]|nr:response regulator transcription factor [Planctomycetota bacterium]
MSKGKVLIVDDEKDLVKLVRYNLEREGYEVLAATTGESGLAMALAHSPRVVILDRMMPGLDGLEVCRQLRQQPRATYLPILLLTAKATEEDRVAGLEAGGDDYITKPFSPRELVARIKAVLRRAPSRASQDVYQVGDLVVDVPRHRVTYRERDISLTAGEFRILRFFAARPGRVFSRAEIIDGALDGSVDGLSRTIDVHLACIRKKLGAGGEQIETVRGVGYRLSDANGLVGARAR